MSDKKPLNIGRVGYGSSGTHSNGYKRVNDFFGDLAYRPGTQGHLRQK